MIYSQCFKKSVSRVFHSVSSNSIFRSICSIWNTLEDVSISFCLMHVTGGTGYLKLEFLHFYYEIIRELHTTI